MRTALENLKRRCREAPDDVKLAVRLALAYERLEDWAGALDEWERIVSLNPDVSLAWYRIADQLLHRGSLGHALEALILAFEPLRKEERHFADMVKRGLSLLRDRAAAFREKAGTISERFARNKDKKKPEWTGQASPRQSDSHQPALKALTLWRSALEGRDKSPAKTNLNALTKIITALNLEPPEPSEDVQVIVSGDPEELTETLVLRLKNDSALTQCLNFSELSVLVHSPHCKPTMAPHRAYFRLSVRQPGSPPPAFEPLPELCLYHAHLTWSGAEQDSAYWLNSTTSLDPQPFNDQLFQLALKYSLLQVGLTIAKLLFADSESGRFPRA